METGGAEQPKKENPVEPKKEEPKPKGEKPIVKAEPPKTAKPETPIEYPPLPEDKNYYVITMSSPNIATSRNWLIDMKKIYPDAILLPQPNGYFRVGVFVGKDKAKGLELMEQVKKAGYKQVWLSAE